MSLVLTNKENHLGCLAASRARMFKKVRAFFEERRVMEVDCPILSQRASCNAHIELIEGVALGKRVFLHSSPEHGMKRLIAAGVGDIYQLSHVFRDEEAGERHNPEFMMCEWYRMGFSFEEMIEETAEFIYLFLEDELKDFHYETLSYKEAFRRYCDIDPALVTLQELQKKLQELGISYPEGSSCEELIYLCFCLFVEPNLGFDTLTAITDFPVTEAALANVRFKDGSWVAMRFEFYYKGFELTNGYHELLDHLEQKKRFDMENEKRLILGKKYQPVDEKFLSALEKGMPDCCGVAVGVDRLMMLHCNTNNIDDVLLFPWGES